MKLSKNRLYSRLTVILMVMFVSLLSGCDVPEGNWTPFKWEIKSIENPDNISAKIKKSTVEVKVSGEGSIVLMCKNYDGMWISGYSDESGYHEFEVLEDAQSSIQESDNLKVVVEDNFVKIIFKQIPENVTFTEIECSYINTDGKIMINYIK